MESLARSMQEDINNYKIRFETNNLTRSIMSENVEDQMLSLNDRLKELEIQGEAQIICSTMNFKFC